ncbi:MAG: class I SAM-dependent methyltransferase [Candidatus Hodarchaeota archaeon]
MFSEINEPFCAGRDASRLLFDLSILLSCIKEIDNRNILDFAGGTGWVSEYLNRAGFDVTIIDIAPEISQLMEKRVKADARLEPARMHAVVCDGHNLDFCSDGYFGNIICFDSLHHMSDLSLVIKEMFRILVPGGRASFAEPGAKHANSRETQEFIRKYKSKDPNWIERSIVLDEINEIANSVGFSPLHIKPFLLPSMVDYSFHDWKYFAMNAVGQKNYIFHLLSFNYDSRVIFFIDKPFRKKRWSILRFQ